MLPNVCLYFPTSLLFLYNEVLFSNISKFHVHFPIQLPPPVAIIVMTKTDSIWLTAYGHHWPSIMYFQHVLILHIESLYSYKYVLLPYSAFFIISGLVAWQSVINTWEKMQSKCFHHKVFKACIFQYSADHPLSVEVPTVNIPGHQQTCPHGWIQ